MGFSGCSKNEDLTGDLQACVKVTGCGLLHASLVIRLPLG